MTSYQSRDQIQTKLRELVPEQVAECKQCDELPPQLEELILHNFQAKFVCYNKEKNTVEVGVEENESPTSYPKIKTRTFPLEETVSWITKTFKSDEQDLKFYGRLIAMNGHTSPVDEVVLV